MVGAKQESTNSYSNTRSNQESINRLTNLSNGALPDFSLDDIRNGNRVQPSDRLVSEKRPNANLAPLVQFKIVQKELNLGTTRDGGVPSGLYIVVNGQPGNPAIEIPILNQNIPPGAKGLQIESATLFPEARPVEPNQAGITLLWPKNSPWAVQFKGYNSAGRLVKDGHIFLDGEGNPLSMSNAFEGSPFTFRRQGPYINPISEVANSPEVLGYRLARIAERGTSPQGLAEIRKIISDPRITDIWEVAAHATSTINGWDVNGRAGSTVTAMAVAIREKYPTLTAVELFGSKSVDLANKLHQQADRNYGAKAGFKELVNESLPDDLLKASIAYDYIYADLRERSSCSLLEVVYRLYGGQHQQMPDPVYDRMVTRKANSH